MRDKGTERDEEGVDERCECASSRGEVLGWCLASEATLRSDRHRDEEQADQRGAHSRAGEEEVFELGRDYDPTNDDSSRVSD